MSVTMDSDICACSFEVESICACGMHRQPMRSLADLVLTRVTQGSDLRDITVERYATRNCFPQFPLLLR